MTIASIRDFLFCLKTQKKNQLFETAENVDFVGYLAVCA